MTDSIWSILTLPQSDIEPPTAHHKIKSFLKEMVGTSITFQGHEIICNFFTPVTFSYTFVEKSSTHTTGITSIHIKDKELSFDQVDAVIRSPSPIVIYKKCLYFSEQIPLWKYTDDQGFITLPNDMVEAIDDIPVHFEEEATKELKPLPELHLTHFSGAFAKLMMNYEGKVSPYKAATVEKTWEQDLLETSYRKKDGEYYCPTHTVKEDLKLLLELGWKVVDVKKRNVTLSTGADLNLDMDCKKIQMRGSLKFSEKNAPIEKVFTAQTFVPLDHESVGLLPPKGEIRALDLLDESFEVVQGGVACQKTAIAKFQTEIPSVNYSEKVHALLKGPVEVELPSKFNGTLRHYQQECLNWLSWLYEGGFSALLADDMGLGKTVQILAFLSTISSDKPHLIIVPTTLLFHWEREWKHFIGEGLHTYYGANRQLDPKKHTLTTYGLLRQDREILEGIDWEVIVIDEGHMIKNERSLTAQSLFSLKSQFRISLTGTPVENHLGELFSQFRFLLPSLLTNEVNLAEKIAPFMLRREKAQVALDLPPIQDQTVYVEMAEEQENLYQSFVDKYRMGLLKKVKVEGTKAHRMEIFELLLRLRQIACHPLLVQHEICTSAKTELALNDITEMLETGKRVLVFSQFTSLLSLIKRELNQKKIPYLYLDGETKNRAELVDRFQNKENPLFLISLKAGGTGLHLTEADSVIILDPWWNEAVEAQGVGRAYRIGRDKPLLVKRYITKGSIEEKIVTLKEKKQHLAENIFTPSSMNLEDLEELLNN